MFSVSEMQRRAIAEDAKPFAKRNGLPVSKKGLKQLLIESRAGINDALLVVSEPLQNTNETYQARIRARCSKWALWTLEVRYRVYPSPHTLLSNYYQQYVFG